MTTPQSPQGGWNPGTQHSPDQNTSWDPLSYSLPSNSILDPGVDPEVVAEEEIELEKERAELSKRNAVRRIKISTAILASVSVVIGLLWGWQQFFWLQLFTDPNSYIETIDGKKLINEDLLDLLNRDSGNDSNTENSETPPVGGVGDGDRTESPAAVARS